MPSGGFLLPHSREGQGQVCCGRVMLTIRLHLPGLGHNPGSRGRRQEEKASSSWSQVCAMIIRKEENQTGWRIPLQITPKVCTLGRKMWMACRRNFVDHIFPARSPPAAWNELDRKTNTMGVHHPESPRLLLNSRRGTGPWWDKRRPWLGQEWGLEVCAFPQQCLVSSFLYPSLALDCKLYRALQEFFIISFFVKNIYLTAPGHICSIGDL